MKKIKLFPLIYLKKQANTTFCPQAMCGAHGYTQRDAWGSSQGRLMHKGAWFKCRGAWASSSCGKFSIFVPFSSVLPSWKPWNLRRILFNLYCLQRPSENNWSSIFISSILHVMYCFFRFTWFQTKKTKNTYEVAMIYDKIELQWSEWKQYKMFIKPLSTSLNDLLFSFTTNVYEVLTFMPNKKNKYYSVELLFFFFF